VLGREGEDGTGRTKRKERKDAGRGKTARPVGRAMRQEGRECAGGRKEQKAVKRKRMDGWMDGKACNAPEARGEK
jgi:hypothetical protein